MTESDLKTKSNTKPTSKPIQKPILKPTQKTASRSGSGKGMGIISPRRKVELDPNAFYFKELLEKAGHTVYRNEWKYQLSDPEAELLKQRLEPFMTLDPHAVDGSYFIRSLYFDDWRDSAYNEKLMGVMHRKKWRIRIYNCSSDVISLERKVKTGNYIHKESAKLSLEEYWKIIDGDYLFLLKKPENLCGEFYAELVGNLLRPKVIVDYDRIPLILDEGTVRITFDMNVRAALGGFDIFDSGLPTLPAMEPCRQILEVKYTEFIPQLIKQLLPPDGGEFTAFSKYTMCYEAAHHITDPTAGLSKFGAVRHGKN